MKYLAYLREIAGSCVSRGPMSALQSVVSRIILTTPLVYGDPARLNISPLAQVQNPLFNLTSGNIEICQYAMIAHNVMFLTGTHDYFQIEEDRIRAAPTEGRDIVVEEGAWIGSGAIILGACRIGRHSVVGAGSVVTKDVAPYTLVAGVPARKFRDLPTHEPACSDDL